MSSIQAIVPSTPGVIPDIAGDFISHLEVAVNGLLKLAIKIHAEKPDILIILSPEQPILHHRFAISNAPCVRAFSSNIEESKHIELEFPTDTEFVDSLVERAFENKIQLEQYMQPENVVAIDNASLGILYYLQQVGMEVPVIFIGMSDHTLATHAALGRVLAETLEIGERHAAVIATGAYDTTSMFTETFIDHLTEQKDLEHVLQNEAIHALTHTRTSLLYPAAMLSGMIEGTEFHELAKQSLGEEGMLVGYFDRK